VNNQEKEYVEIKELVTDEGFQIAKNTLTSYYTEQSVISHMIVNGK